MRVDDYYWLRDRGDPEVVAYLKAENAYLDERMRHTRGLQERLFAEIKGRIPQTDASAPYRDGAHRYYWRCEEGRQYRIYCRKPLDAEAEQIILDVNEVAAGHAFCDAVVAAARSRKRMA